jgi:hypothetical protein
MISPPIEPIVWISIPVYHDYSSQCLTINAIITANNKPSNEHTKLPLNSVIIATPNSVNDNAAVNTKKILLNVCIRLKIKRATYKIASRPMIRLYFT